MGPTSGRMRGKGSIAESAAARGLMLLGTVHSDRRGFARTRAFLETYGPDLVLVEISPFGVEFRKKHSVELRKTLRERVGIVDKKLGISHAAALRHSRIADIYRQFGLPFEYRAAATYAKKAAIEVLTVDSSDFSREWIATWPEMISEENIELLLGLESTAPRTSALYARAAREIAEGPSGPALHGTDAGIWQKREEYMAAQMVSALERFHPARPVYLGGWWHLTWGGSVRTLREILGVLAGGCVLVDRWTQGQVQ